MRTRRPTRLVTRDELRLAMVTQRARARLARVKQNFADLDIEALCRGQTAETRQRLRSELQQIRELVDQYETLLNDTGVYDA